MTTTETPPSSAPGGLTKSVVTLDRVVIRLAGDSGDGMQLTGNRFTSETASFGNDLSTLPNFPAEIRAPTGTLPGVSSFQLHFADHDIMTPGDAPDVLVVMNPAALKANIADLPGGGLLIADSDEFSARNLAKVGYATNPLEDGSLAGWQLVSVPLTSMTTGRAEGLRAGQEGGRALEEHVHAGPVVVDVSPADRGHGAVPGAAVPQEAGHRGGEHRRVPGRLQLRGDDRGVRGLLRDQARPDGARHVPQHLRQPGALLGLVAAGQRSGLPLFLGAYPITPASDILHELSKHKAFGVRTFQAEDEIAGIGAAIGASFGGALGVTTTSGPGHLAEVGGHRPGGDDRAAAGGGRRAARRTSTGLPTKTEQSDLLQAMFGRNGEAPVPVIAPRSPGDCFDAAIEAPRIALTYRTPVILLSDGYLANGAEPWAVPSCRSCRTDRRSTSRPSPTARTASSCRTCGTRRRWPGRGRSRHGRPAAPPRRAGEGRPDRATSATTRRTTTS